MPETLYWYDFETTGTDPILDRPLQFAGVRTDPDLKEIEAPQSFFCKPGNDVIPHPEALLVTGILMSDTGAQGLSERDFAHRVLEQFSQPETCVAGFNNLRFDDEFTRQMLYRNFYDPYAREWRMGNSRWDIIDLFRAARALRPEGFNWPQKEDGAPSFRLEDLARANGMAHPDAHDALADVRATITVARLLKAAQPKLYAYTFRLRDRNAVLRQLYPLGKQPVIHVSSRYPAARCCIAVVLPLCRHPVNNNAIICVDLSQSPDALIEATPAELERLVFTKTEDLGAHEERVALKAISINRCPFVAPMSTLRERDADRLAIDMAVCEAHAARIRRTAGIVDKVQDVYGRAAFEPDDDPDFQLYSGGFFPDADRATMTELLAAPPEQLDAYTGRFRDARLDEMLFRFRARNHYDLLGQAERRRWDAWRRDRWAGGLSPERAEARIDELLAAAGQPAEKQAAASVLLDLRAYLAALRRGLAD